MLKKNQKGFTHLLLMVLLVVVIGVVSYAGYRVISSKKSASSLPSLSANGQVVAYDKKVSEQLTNGRCKGAGSVNIGPPMPIDQISFILPYGIVVGGHVTPIDHQYYNGLDPHALRDTYDVIAPANGTIVDIEHRGTKTNTPPHTANVPSSDEYRLVVAHTCSFLTYVDLVTSLSSQVKAKLPSGWQPNGNSGGVNIPVTKGEIIGHIGGQTLDFAVWDLSKPLKGFVNTSDYTDESWKQFTAPSSEYLDLSVKAQVTAKYIRSVTPIDGKIDYDIDGKLIGNWFQDGSGGYHAASNTAQNYWKGHLSIAPDAIDPSVYVASIGNYDSYTGSANASSYNGGAEQFMIKNASPDPASVGQSNGLVKYELLQKSYTIPNGQPWDNMSLATGIKAIPSNNQVTGTILAQITGPRTLKFEVFPSKTNAQVSGFDNKAKLYTR